MIYVQFLPTSYIFRLNVPQEIRALRENYPVLIYYKLTNMKLNDSVFLTELGCKDLFAIINCHGAE